jgi:hypothetical protein
MRQCWVGEEGTSHRTEGDYGTLRTATVVSTSLFADKQLDAEWLTIVRGLLG